MKLIAKLLGFEAGRNLVVLGVRDAEELDVRTADRVRLRSDGREVMAIATIARAFPQGRIGLFEEVASSLEVGEGSLVEVEAAPPPDSLAYVRKKLAGGRLREDEVRAIVRDIVSGYLSDVELAAFITAVYLWGFSIDEAYSFTKAMVETGETLNLGVKPVLDKHSMGGVPGDKTSLILVPVIASLGFYIPKTSSRAITSPAGTADRMEVLAPVALSVEEVRRVVLKVGGCIVWGGALGLAPADDMIIRVEYPLGVDPFYLPSILAKKVAVGSTHVVLDIPTGRGTKVKSVVEARDIAREFMDLASMLGLRMEAVVTYGDEPIGRAVGPALEAREALEALMGRGSPDLVNKAVGLAGVLLDMIEAGGRNAALDALRSGRALRKMREIIEEQGGDPNVRPEDLPVGDKRLTVRAEEDGYVMFIDNSLVARIGRLAGAPRDKGAGVMLYVKVGDRVRRGDPLFTVYAESGARLQAVEKLLEEALPVSVGRGAAARMLLERVLPKPKTITLLER